MRRWLLVVIFAGATPRAEAGEFAPRAPKAAAMVEPGGAAVAKAKSSARSVARRRWAAKAAAQHVKPRKRASEKRPLP